MSSLEDIFDLGGAATPKQIEEWTGQKLDPRAAGTRLVGARLLVIRDRTPKKEGSIFVPDVVQDRNPMGSGTVIAAGPLAGQGYATYPGELSFRGTGKPEDMLGLRVYFEMYSGTAFRSSLRDQEWKADLLILLTKDLLAVDTVNSPRWRSPTADFIDP